ncbi:hypothetical protein [Nocardioides gilvus]|uniref:hypothetical protein n=1 Tax=Nocardioides gilvus TaxID=1735589 RepID=UPI0013A5B2EE|nr:hypothetical protein [Nocardioides gilvus]
MVELLLLVVSVVVLYFVVRMGVRDGILDADDVRASRAQARRFKEKLRDGALPDITES